MSQARIALIAAVLVLVTGGAASPFHTSADPTVVGQLGNLIPLHKDAIHAGLSPDLKKICFWMRPSEYRGTDLVNPLAPGGTPASLKPEFADYAYGGFGFSTGPHGLDQSLSTRITEDLALDNGLCLDLTDPAAAFPDTGKIHFRDLTAADFALNAPAFSNVGDPAGLDYNIFCSGQVALDDGRWLFVGGHMYSGNNGIRKLNLFDPRKERWEDRGVPPVKDAFLADPLGLGPRPDPRVEANADPPHESDMRYARWYPTAVTLPDGKVLILSGTDQDASLGPRTSRGACTSTSDAACSKVRHVVPEVYDPKTDRTIALENARKQFAMYPRAYVVQTGPRRTDWKVAVIAEVRPPEPTLETLAGYDPWSYSGKTYLLDVRAALADPERDLPAEKHWQFVDEAQIAHDSGAGAQLWELDEKGHAIRQRVVLFGGDCGDTPPAGGCDRATVEMIDFQAATPKWVRQANLVVPASQNNAVVLPNGKVLVMGGVTGRPRCVPPGPSPWNNSFHYQLFDPDAGTMTPLVETTHPLHDHSTAALLPTGAVAALGGNRTDLANDACDLVSGVPAFRLYRPTYFFTGGEAPVIKKAPDRIKYQRRFVVETAEGSAEVASLVLIRPGPVTHNWDWGNRYVKLWFKQTSDGKLQVQAPALPGLAVPGYYMLFALNSDGVPSLAQSVHLRAEDGDKDDEKEGEADLKKDAED